MVKEIYKTKGLYRGFYAGSMPNLGRILIKNAYRYPLMIGLPSFYQKNLPDKVRENLKLQKLLTGSSKALLERFIICPFERMKTYFMTVSHE
jgi:hypothetical protein